MTNRQTITNYLNKTIKELYNVSDEVVKKASLSYPPQETLGDYASSIPLILSKEVGKNPMGIAEEIKGVFPQSDLIAEITIAKPGFLNFKLSQKALSDTITQVIDQGQRFGNLQPEQPQKIQVEFVSANPTGPLHIGNFRGGPLGDSIARVLTKAGHTVEREYYHNDVGNQVKLLGESMLWRIKKLNDEDAGEFPVGGYQGEYVKQLAELGPQLAPIHNHTEGKQLTGETLGKWAVDYYRDQTLMLCEKTGINFDYVISESEIRDTGWTKKALDTLREKNVLKQKDGATWFAPSDDFLEDRETVVIKSDGQYDYFSNDIGYHYNKFDRDFDKVIDVWGANHHGHIPRMKAALKFLGIRPERLEVVLYQWVTLLRNGLKLGMSKRAGTFVTTEEVLKEVGSDALRFMFLTRDANTPLEFDIDLVKKQARDNPVYYVQYAHARMSGILKKSNQNVGVERAQPETLRAVHALPLRVEEIRLVKHLMKFPELIEDISENLAVHQLTNYALDLADLFHKFYENCPVLPDRDKTVTTEISKARLALVSATRTVLAETLGLLGVSAPTKM